MLKPILELITRPLIRNLPFKSSADYWERRYRLGGDSGRKHAEENKRRKAIFINEFAKANGVGSVVEFGCGDGTVLAHANYPQYLGFDVSRSAITMCRRKFRHDSTKQFRLVSDYEGEMADLVLSLDVIYHLVEDDVFEDYMGRLFGAARRYVLIRSTNRDEDAISAHVRHRAFTEWVDQFMPDFRLIEHRPCAEAGYFIYERRSAAVRAV